MPPAPPAAVLVTVRVRPGAARTRVGGRYGDAQVLTVSVTERAVDGAATTAVLRAVAQAFGVRPRQVRLIQGAVSRTKVVAVEVDPVDGHRRLQELLDSR